MPTEVIEVVMPPEPVIDVVMPAGLSIDVAVMQGAKGDTGDAGPPGGAVYVHTQGSAATTWTIAHNLGFRPSIELLDTGGAEIEGDVIHSTVNTAFVYFTTAIAGTARCL